MSVLDIDILMSDYQENVILAKKFIEDNYSRLNPGALQFREIDGEVVVDCDDELVCKNLDIMDLTNGKFRFGKVFVFDCSRCGKLISLKGAPRECNKFDCSCCGSLTSLEGVPEKCVYFNCACCYGLTSLKYAPEECVYFNCAFCYGLTSLNGAPRKCDVFKCLCCENLISLDGAPKYYNKFIC